MLFRTHILLVFLMLGGYGYTSSAMAAQPVIFHASLSAQSGDAISLQGDFSAAATVWLRPGADAAAVSLPVRTQRAGHCIAQLPTSLRFDLYQVWVNDSGGDSSAVYLNRAWGQHFDTPEISAGSSFRLFGRNLRLGDRTPQVRMVNRATGASRPVAVVLSQSDAYTLRLMAPDDVVNGATYDFYVSNGWTGPNHETKTDKALLGIAAGADYFDLGVPWAAKLNFYQNVYNVKTDNRLALKAVGDGNTNDQPAIQAAIDRANADGGGIVYLPPGTYKLDGQAFQLNMKSRVVIKGAGAAQSILRYGYGAPANDKWGVVWGNTEQAGFADLSLINVDATGTWVNNMSNFGSQTKELLLKRCRFNLSRGDWYWLAGTNKLVIADSEITQGLSAGAGYHGPVQFDGIRHFVIARNTFNYAVWGLNLTHAEEGVFENNLVYRDGSARYPNEVINHVLILDFAENVAVTGNLFKVINGPAQNKNDGEAIIAEGGGGNRADEDAGTVSRASPTTLEDDAKNWSGFSHRPVVAIINGPGMGQFRKITSRSGNRLNVDRAWDVLPTAASRYSIFNWGSRNWLVRGNVFEGNRRGITLYWNGTNQVAIVGNRLTNSGSIDLTPVQGFHSIGVQEFVPMYDNQIVDNVVENLDGSNGVFIGVHTVQYIQNRSLGTSVIGLEVRGNILTAHIPNVPAEVDALFPEGYLNYLQYQPLNSNYQDEGIPVVLGSIFQNNVSNNADHALHLNTGSYNTFVSNMTRSNSPQLLSDQTLDGNSHGAVGSAFGARRPPVSDFDGDGKSDLSVFRPSNGYWYRLNSGSNDSFFAAQFGSNGDKIVPADFDGDGKTDLAVFRPSSGVWYLQRSTTGFAAIQFGAAEDIPVPADFDADGKADIAVFRPSSGIWYVQRSSQGFYSIQFGSSGDIPQIGDFDGDNKADVSVFRRSNGTWYRLNSFNNQLVTTQFGANTDVPNAADFDGDGKTDLATFRPSNGYWFVQGSSSGFTAQQFGMSGDRPAAADYNGDGRADVAVFRPASGVWFINRSSQGFYLRQFGAQGDVPAESAFTRAQP